MPGAWRRWSMPRSGPSARSNHRSHTASSAWAANFSRCSGLMRPVLNRAAASAPPQPETHPLPRRSPAQMKMRDIMARAPVIPVLTIEREADAVPLARALCAGGLTVLEVTLRTPVALSAIAAMRKAVPEAIVGAGTLTQPEDFERVAAAAALKAGDWAQVEALARDAAALGR